MIKPPLPAPPKDRLIYKRSKFDAIAIWIAFGLGIGLYITFIILHIYTELTK